MFRHVVIWNLDDRFSEEEKERTALEIKTRLETFSKELPEVEYFHVQYGGFPPSTGDLILDSSFATREALEHYKTHPTHVEIGGFVRSVVKSRASMDYEA